jgi:succinoglycan biosynthesis protein ExoW
MVVTKKITVVIPFYQKNAGILTKAVTSAIAQRGLFTLEILIVDDASPVPAGPELAELMRACPGLIRVIVQPNGGPAAARNRALDAIGTDTEYVAFLDSDDEWIPTHLENGLRALEAGHDFHFADFYQLNQTVSAFKRAGRIDPARHRTLDASGHLYTYVGDMFQQILTGNVIGTSTVMYRYSRFPTLRFREEFVNAGEDYLFWLGLVCLTDRISFSSLCECTYGEGVNIFAGSGWGTEKSLVRIHYEMKYKKAIGRLFALSEEQQRGITRDITGLRKSFVADLLHRIVRRKPMGKKRLLREHWQIDPTTFLLFVPLTVQQLLRRQRGS